MTIKICSAPGCKKPAYKNGGGNCSTHAKDRRAGRPYRVIEPRRKRDMTTEEFLEYFWSNGKTQPAPYPELQGDCLIWQGGGCDGYGTLERFRKTYKVHRLAWEIHHGREMRPGMVAEHLCEGKHENSKKCYNPLHIRESTYEENSMTAKKYGMLPVGEAAPSSKLSATDIPIIRKMRAEGMTVRGIAKHFGRSYGCILKVVQGVTWKSAS